MQDDLTIVRRENSNKPKKKKFNKKIGQKYGLNHSAEIENILNQTKNHNAAEGWQKLAKINIEGAEDID